MDHHHKIVGFLFAYTATGVINFFSAILFDLNNRLNNDKLKHRKMYWCCVFAILLGLIQLIFSTLLAVRGGHWKRWSSVHIPIALGYVIIFSILILDDKNMFWTHRHYNFYLAQNFLLLLPVCVFNIIYYKKIYVPLLDLSYPSHLIHGGNDFVTLTIFVWIITRGIMWNMEYIYLMLTVVDGIGGNVIVISLVGIILDKYATAALQKVCIGRC